MSPCWREHLKNLLAGLHEIKHDGFRIIARKNGAQVRLYSRPGNELHPPLPADS